MRDAHEFGSFIVDIIGLGLLVMAIRKALNIGDDRFEYAIRKSMNSKEIFDKSIKCFKNVSMVATVISHVVGGKTAQSFRCQLGLPEEGSGAFKMMKPKFQKRLKKLIPPEELCERFSAVLVNLHYADQPFTPIANSLKQHLKDMEKLSFNLLS